MPKVLHNDFERMNSTVSDCFHVDSTAQKAASCNAISSPKRRATVTSPLQRDVAGSVTSSPKRRATVTSPLQRVDTPGSTTSTPKKRPSDGGMMSPTLHCGVAANLTAVFSQSTREPGDGRDSIVVAIRVRPFTAKEMVETGKEATVVVEDTSIRVKCDASVKYSKWGAEEKDFRYDFVFSSHLEEDSRELASQQCVFNTIGASLIENAFNAYNGCLLAYGQTGSGKTHTMVGDLTSETEKGIIPRSCEKLLDLIESAKTQAEREGSQLQANIYATYLEIYQEKMFDLLVSNNTRTDLLVRLHPTKGPIVPQLVGTPCNSIADMMSLLEWGTKNRAVGSTHMNAQSSRSHTIFTVEVHLAYTGEIMKDQQSKLHFVDLAGSEKLKKTQASGERLQEGIAINQSLGALSRVIVALASSPGTQQPPFRESKLTMLLKDALGGNSRTILVACVSPSKFDCEETITSLEFASRCKMIKTNPRKNEENKQDLLSQMTAQKLEFDNILKKELAEKRAIEERFQHQVAHAQQIQEAMLQVRDEKLSVEHQLARERQLRAEEEEVQEARAALERERAELESLRRDLQQQQAAHREEAQNQARQPEDQANQDLHLEQVASAEAQSLAENERLQLETLQRDLERQQEASRLERAELERLQRELQQEQAAYREDHERRMLELEEACSAHKAKQIAANVDEETSILRLEDVNHHLTVQRSHIFCKTLLRCGRKLPFLNW